MKHPYIPEDADVPHYAENVTSLWVLQASFGYMLFASVSVVVYLSKRLNPLLARSDLWAIAWFALCKFELDWWPKNPFLVCELRVSC